MTQQVKFYQTGTFTVGNRLLDEESRTVQATIDRSNSLTSGHRACQGCGEALGARYAMDAAMRAAGKRVVAVNATGCLEVFSTPYPESSWQVAWLHSLFGNAPAVATGVAAALRAKGREDVHVLAQGGDGGTVDIGFGCLSGMFERNDDVLYICYDNEAYMNTGVQRSSATPPTARTATTPALGDAPGNVFGTGKNLPAIAMAHNIPYVATASVADLHDLEAKVTKATEIRGARYIHIMVPCPLGWGSASEDTIRVARLAVESGLFPLFGWTPGIAKDYQLSLMNGSGLLLGDDEMAELTSALCDTVLGTAQLGPLLRQGHRYSDFHINGADRVFAKERGSGRIVALAPIVDGEAELVDLVKKLIRAYAPGEPRFDAGSPAVDIQLPDGERVHAMRQVVDPPVVLAIRIPDFSLESIDDLIGNDTIEPEMARFLHAVVAARLNLIVAGGTGSGKTTLLRVLLNEVDPMERIVTIEDLRELHLARFPKRNPNAWSAEAVFDRLPATPRPPDSPAPMFAAPMPTSSFSVSTR